MNDTGDPDVDELEQLRRENADLKRRLQFFLVEHRFIGRFTGLILFGPRLTRSIHDWLLRATLSNPLPVEETSALLAAVARRLTAVGLFGLVFPGGLLLWQNCLIQDQNRYFREQTKELRRQIAIQEEQGDFARRKELIEAIYDGKGLSIRTRVEAVKALVRLDNKLLDQGTLAGDKVDLRGVDFSCVEAASRECADFSGAWLVRTDFSGSKFLGADFKGADLRDTSFVSADLSEADFSFASLEGAQFREILFTPAFVTFHLKGLVLESGLSAAALAELKGIVDGQHLELKGREVIWAEFTLERVSVSAELSSSINRLTKAAVLRDTKILASSERSSINRLIKAGVLRDPNILASLEDSWHLDQYTRLPMGVMPSKAKIDREKLKILDEIQAKADEIFGHYKTKIHLRLRGGESVACTTIDGSLINSDHDLDYYARLPSRGKESFVQELCGVEFKFRIRSALPFPERVR